jgi:DNA-binding NarL/FixJ family response regulator
VRSDDPEATADTAAMGAQLNSVVRVMLVEDDQDMRERFAAAISNDPRTGLAEKVGTGREAIARLPAVSPDVLLVDLGLPDVHGTEVIRFAARTVPECDIMVITLFGDESSVLKSIEAGATGYILKDCTDSQLVDCILELKAGGAPMSPTIARLVLHRMQHGGPSKALISHEPGNQGLLTHREIEVLGLLARGYVYAEIADRLGISLNTVGSHIKNCYRKLAVHTGPAAVTRAAKLGLLRPGDPDP